MKKKQSAFAVVFIILLICLCAYFKPLFLSNTSSDYNRISMTLNEFGIIDGKPDINPIVYESVSENQEKSIFDLMKVYPYKRTFGTPFSDGFLTDMGDETLSFFLYEDNTRIDYYIISSSGKIVVNNKNYHMKNADQFIKQVIQIMQ